MPDVLVRDQGRAAAVPLLSPSVIFRTHPHGLDKVG